MINRRLIRVKTLQALYSYYQAGDSSISRAEKELEHSIARTYDLYFFTLLLLLDIVQYAKSKIEFAKNKLVPSYEDLNPNTKFIENKVIEQLKENEMLKSYLNTKKLSWVNNQDVIKKMYNTILESEQYKTYKLNESRAYDGDKKIIIFILDKIINESEDFYTSLEDQSIYWNDNIDYAVTMVIKTIKKYKIGDSRNAQLMDKYKNKDDQDFVVNLIRKTLLNQAYYKELINKNVKNWDIDRLALLDMIIMQMALSEVLNFPEIPIKVTINEYIEISKYYSTEKSSIFINGILDKIIKDLKKENKIVKIGRGLIGDNDEEPNGEEPEFDKDNI